MTERLLLAGKAAIVTGAATGIGAAIATLFAREGATVLAVDRDPIDLPNEPRRIETLRLDITEADAAVRIAEAAAARLGGLDILVNNAGIVIPGHLETASLDDWQRTLDVNLTAPLRIVQAVLPMLKASRAPRIVNLGSILSDVAQPDLGAYTVSKHGVAGLSKALAVDLGRYGIAVNYLQPGVVWTPLAAVHLADPAIRRAFEERTALDKVGAPEDVAAAALFLAGDSAGYLSGSGVRVDGGMAAKI
jgi:NAD(P)-dependent dehydrogenase (short-subunit alcohol dehydrogenase family)